jgi:WD40 repeat protein
VVAVGAANGAIDRLDRRTGVLTPWHRIAAPVSSLGILADGTLVSLDTAGELTWWPGDARVGSTPKTMRVPSGNKIIVAPEGDRFVTTSAAGEVRLWSGDGRLLRALHHEGSTDAAFSATGLVASGGADRRLRLFRAGHPVDLWLPGAWPILRVQLSADGRWLAAAGLNGQVQLWRVDPIDWPPTAPSALAQWLHQHPAPRRQDPTTEPEQPR